LEHAGTYTFSVSVGGEEEVVAVPLDVQFLSSEPTGGS
jgi:hypothetical protein